jgi:glycosyltransferase involved in cell wall biosynthesis
VREALPLVRARGPVTFDVVGELPLNPVAGDGVTYHGRVPSVRPYYERAHALVVPVFQGSGTRLKALEAAALGRPVVSTELGMEGLPLLPGDHYLPAEDAEGFAAACGRLRTLLGEGRNELDAMTASARVAAEPFFWDRVVANLAESYEAELGVRG